MPDEAEDRTPNSPRLPGDSSIVTPAPPAAKPGSMDKWAVRRAELKRQKRRAHRRKINASNTPG